ncbi:hypothetical protein ScPMuIL_008913 [Solemya velum]
MAKSIRSKWRRKMRNVKREKYGKKNLDQLKKILVKDDVTNMDSEMKELCTVKTATQIKEDKKAAKGDSEMDVDKKLNKKSLRDEHGTYPSWMNKRIIRNMQNRRNAKRIKEKIHGLKKLERNSVYDDWT